MEQKNIREFGGEQYTKEEGAALIKELNDRTVFGDEGYNSIADLAEKLKISEGAVLSGYKGALLISDTPTAEGFYTPTEAGTYSNAGGLIYDPEDSDKGYLVQFILSDGVWSKNRILLEIDINGKIELNNKNAISGGEIYPLLKYSSNFLNILNSGDFPFLDFSSYVDVLGSSVKEIKEGGLSTVNTGDTQIATGKIFDNTTEKITLRGICVSNNASFFGIGLKNGDDWGGMMYRGTSGARSMLDYASSSFMTGAGISSSSGYVEGDEVIVEIMFLEGLSYIRTAVNNVYSSLSRMSEQYNNVDNGGEVHICFRSSSEWDNLSLNVTKTLLSTDKYYLSPTGDDQNRGSYDTPLATLNEANSRLKGKGEIILKKGDYFNLNYEFKEGVHIRGENKDLSRIINAQKIISAELVSGKVYKSLSNYIPNNGEDSLFQYGVPEPSTNILDNERLAVHGRLDYRCPITRRIVKVNSIEEIEQSNELSFYYDGTDLFFSKVQDSDLSVNPIIVPKFASYIISNNVKISNLTILGEGITSKSFKLELNDINIGAINNSNIYGSGGSESSFGECQLNRVNSFHSSNDGFSGKGYGKLIEKECWSHDNLDEGSSIHEVCTVSRINSIYEYNKSRGVVDVGSTSVYMIGCYFQGNIGGSATFSNQVIYGKDFQNARVINCVLQESQVPINSGNIKFIGCSTIG
jgi:hypothetical protein